MARAMRASVTEYNHHRPNYGDYMAGRTPLEVKKQTQTTHPTDCCLTTTKHHQRRRPVTPTRAPEALDGIAIICDSPV